MKCETAKALVATLIQEASAGLEGPELDEVDVSERPEVAVKYGVMSTPAIASNGRLEFSGVPREDALRARLRAAAAAPSPWAVAAGLLVLALIGWAAWNYGAIGGLRWVEFDSPLTLAALGFLAGIGAFFAPCAFALFPGYVSYYLTSTGSRRESVGRSLGLGLTCATGSALFFALAGGAIVLIGGAISPYLIAAKPVIALAVVLLGVVLVADMRLPSVALPLGAIGGRLPASAGLFLYGFGYALASTGCTLPLYVSMVVLPLTSGYSGAALLTFTSFAVAMALMMLLTSLLVGLAKATLLRRLQASTAVIKRISGLVLIAAGLYLGYYYVAAGM